MPAPSDTPMSSPTPVHATLPIRTTTLSPIITGYPPGPRTLTFAPPSTNPLPWPQLPNYPRILTTTPSNLAGIESLSLPTLTIADAIATMLFNHSPASLAQFFGPLLCGEEGADAGLAEEEDTPVTFVREEVEETSEEEEERGFEALVPRGCLLVSRRGRDVLAGPFQHTSGGALFPVQVVYTIKSTGEWAPRLVRFDTHCEELWGVYEPWSKGAVRHVSGDEGEVRGCGERLAKEWLAMRKWEGSEEVLDEDGERICVGVKVQLRMEVGEINVDWLL